jgi:uncharacterized repeat protein (TIGR03803 family)
MTLNDRPQLAIRVLLWLGVVLATVSLASAEWKEKVLYSFQGGSDGSTPGGGVVFDSAGNLYGVTVAGGSTACNPGWCGTIYQLSPPAQKGGSWTETVLYVFKGHSQNDGSSPSGKLITDSSGNLYGTTGYGGSGPCLLLGTATGCGTVFELSPPAKEGSPWTETVLYDFKGGNDGDLPNGALVFDSAGNLYGATDFGGSKGTTCDPYYQYCGTVFKLSPPKTKGGKWTEKVLHSFAGISNSQQNGDGANPNGGLVLDSNGNLFGTTSIGGHSSCPGFEGVGCGTVFELNPPAKEVGKWTEQIIHRFTRGNDGAGLSHGVIVDAKGALYGTTGLGGTQDSGVVFRFTHRNGRWTETILHNCNGRKDDSGGCDLAIDALGNLYCATGAILRLKPPKQKGGQWVPEILYEFGGPPDGRSPLELTFGKSSALYGTTTWGGTGQACQGGCGTVFEVSP